MAYRGQPKSLYVLMVTIWYTVTYVAIIIIYVYYILIICSISYIEGMLWQLLLGY